jgi:hypothetical protein
MERNGTTLPLAYILLLPSHLCKRPRSFRNKYQLAFVFLPYNMTSLTATFLEKIHAAYTFNHLLGYVFKLRVKPPVREEVRFRNVNEVSTH